MNTCEKCKKQFTPLPGKEWAKECFDCWKLSKANPQVQPAVKQSSEKKNSSFYTSYAKDLMVALIAEGNTNVQEVAQTAIGMLNLAIEAYE